jgi:hypothetical protein
MVYFSTIFFVHHIDMTATSRPTAAAEVEPAFSSFYTARRHSQAHFEKLHISPRLWLFPTPDDEGSTPVPALLSFGRLPTAS